METRRTTKRKHSSSKNNEDNVRHLDMDNPKNWTKEKLLSEILRIGIKVPSNLKVNTLIQIYNDNKKDFSIVPSENLISVAETSAALIQQTRQSDSCVQPDINQNDTAVTTPQFNVLQSVVSSVPTTTSNTQFMLQPSFSSTQTSASNQQHSVLQPTMNSTQITALNQQHSVLHPITNCTQMPALNQQHSVLQPTINSTHMTTATNLHYGQSNASVGVDGILRQQGVPAERYRNVEVVSTQLRNQIIAGKDINLALLLIPNNESTSEYRRVDFDGVEYVMKPGDPRLAKSLTLGEFTMAFSRHKNIVCEALPNRRVELDQYERDIVEMANQFGGTRFYDYHKAFSAKAAALLQQHHVKVDWSIRDNNLFCTIFAGMKANICGLCSSITHSTEFCPLLVNPNLKKGQNQNMNSGNNQNNSPNNSNRKTDRNNVTFQGIQLCHNYNERACYRKQNCKYLHLCYDCHSPHPKSQCRVKPKEKTDTNDKKGPEKVEKTNQ